MKKLLFICVLFITSSYIFSQTKNDSYKEIKNIEVKKNLMRERIAKELNLTEDQIKLINSIDDKYKDQEESLRKKSKALREQHHILMEEKRSEVEKILTKDQIQKLNDIKSKFHKKREHKEPNCLLKANN